MVKIWIPDRKAHGRFGDFCSEPKKATVIWKSELNSTLRGNLYLH
jgi:hypothetical protein